MNHKYDVIVVGAGPAGIFACYELSLKLPQAKILLIDKGHDIFRRHCPILEKKLKNVLRQWAKNHLPAAILHALLQMGLEARGRTRMGNLI